LATIGLTEIGRYLRDEVAYFIEMIFEGKALVDDRFAGIKDA
jgi:hypothetical protein